MTALLGLLAVAGFQNRDKIADMLKGAGSTAPGAPERADQPGGLGGLLSNLGSGGLGGLLGGGLGELVENFKQHGQGEVAESWVGSGPNKQIAPDQLEQAIGPEVLATLTQQTGLSREELLSRLTTTLPEAVDKYTPDGRLPPAADLSQT
jgi:uncharacterized protein YidB (DUF937 family)